MHSSHPILCLGFGLLGSLFIAPVLGSPSLLNPAALNPAAQEAEVALAETGMVVTTPEWKAKVDGWVGPLLEDRIVVGMSIGVLQGGQRWAKGYGRLDLEKAGVPDENTIFEIGSISKTFTGVLLADAIGRGIVQAEDTVQSFLPEECKLIERKAPIQLVHLANHTSGWPRMPKNFDPANPLDPFADYTEELLWEFLGDHKPVWKPGRLPAYSNLGMGTLGLLLASKQDTTYDALVLERIIRPLGMENSGVKLTATMKERIASPYDSDLEPNAVWEFASLAGAGGIRSSIADMLLYADAAMGDREDALGGALALSQVVTYESRSGATMGMGWQVSPERGEVWHNGQTGGYHSYLVLHRASQTAVVILSNTAAGEVDQLGRNLMRELRGESTQPWSYRKSISLEPAQLEPFVGRFGLTEEIVFDVTLQDGKLYAQLTGQGRFRLHAETPTRFFYRVVDAQISFELTEDGRCDALVLHQNGEKRAERLKD